jgi:transcriptional regulator with PAS, ATPase and Fis domain
MLVGQSLVMQRLREQVRRIARTSFTVLIEGESGAGKELVARQIHEQSSRAEGPFVAVNCAALVESLLEAELFGIEERTATGVRGRRGKFEQAHGGTLFLDEIGDLSMAAQAKLLRVLQDLAVERVGGHLARVVDTRIVAATNRGLLSLVASGGCRSDLYYRLAGVEVVVPPLRDHREDIPELVACFLAQRDAGHFDVTPGVVHALEAFDWPGNVRQLGRVVERAIALSSSGVITLSDLPPEIAGRRQAVALDHGDHGDQTLRAWTSRYVRLVLDRCNGNKRRACDVLDISYRTLQGHLTMADAAAREDDDEAPAAHAAGGVAG